ncbi:hypothetical protein ED733_000236 [Metarhizium rileyi]|uniref:ATP-dependent DNA helicase n=1 Tax=Metarhizium rileyi (strain RCEF 4871) TaxID=1649241 RepID=A0A5C6G3R3_METRR|nr:hypothetical protein ED733_000236 [Metarhizium rileyi]
MVTATSGSAACQIDGTTVHLAFGIQPSVRNSDAVGKGDVLVANAYQDAQRSWRWQRVKIFVMDEVSMLGGALLYKTDEALRRLRASTTSFGGIHVVPFTGNFFLFGPLVILQEQVRAGGEPLLKRLLRKLRNFQQDSSDIALINSRVLKDGKIPYDKHVRVITPLNQHQWDLNTQEVMMWAKRMGRKVSVFLSTHEWTKERPSEDEMMRVFEQGDDKDCPIPAIFVYADGMPVIVNENLYLGLRVVNGSVLRAAGIVPDRQHQPVRANIDVPDTEDSGADMVSEMGVNINFGSPSAIILESKSTAKLSFPGIPPGTVTVCPSGTAMRAWICDDGLQSTVKEPNKQ